MLLGGARRARRRHPAQPDALRLPDPRAEGAAPSRARRRRARGAPRRAGLCRRARSSAPARSARLLLAIRAGGSGGGLGVPAAGPAHDHAAAAARGRRSPLNLLGLFELPVLGGRRAAGGQLRRPARSRPSSRRPAPGPFLGAALGTALLLPPAGSVLVFAALGLGLALPFLRSPSFPRFATRLPKPGPWMERLQRFLAIPMAATAVACLWLLWRVRRRTALHGRAGRGGGHGAAAWSAPACCSATGKQSGYWAALAARCGRGGRGLGDAAALGDRPSARDRRRRAVERSARSRATLRAGPAGVRLFHRRLVPDLQGQRSRGDRPRRGARRVRQGRRARCSPATGPTAIRRSPASSKAAAAPACRFISGTSRARQPEELPQVLTPAMLISRARPRSARRALPHLLPGDPGFQHLRSRQRLRVDRWSDRGRRG